MLSFHQNKCHSFRGRQNFLSRDGNWSSWVQECSDHREGKDVVWGDTSFGRAVWGSRKKIQIKAVGLGSGLSTVPGFLVVSSIKRKMLKSGLQKPKKSQQRVLSWNKMKDISWKFVGRGDFTPTANRGAPSRVKLWKKTSQKGKIHRDDEHAPASSSLVIKSHSSLPCHSLLLPAPHFTNHIIYC